MNNNFVERSNICYIRIRANERTVDRKNLAEFFFQPKYINIIFEKRLTFALLASFESSF